MEDLTTAVSEFALSIDTVWILITAVLVMFMQAGFAMVEAGFTRTKNTANILMKNLMDFAIGSIIFWILGYTLMYGDDIGGFLGKVSLFFGSNEINGVPDMASLMFQTVFAAFDSCHPGVHDKGDLVAGKGFFLNDSGGPQFVPPVDDRDLARKLGQM